MSPTTHLLASWIIAAKTTDNPRDCRLVTLAGVLPDLDGLGLIVDVFNSAVRHKHTEYYQDYHHVWLHGLFGALVTTGLLTCFARRRLRVALLAFLTFHLHLLCDYVGSRGPDKGDIWPIAYLEPFSQKATWFCRWQWPLSGWQNIVISVVLFVIAMAMTLKVGHSIIGVFSQRADKAFVATLQKWWSSSRRPPAEK
jgi:hypothetical protein